MKIRFIKPGVLSFIVITLLLVTQMATAQVDSQPQPKLTQTE